MSKQVDISPAVTSPTWPLELVREAWSYGFDAVQRGILFFDVMRQRAEANEQHAAKEAPHVLKFHCELCVDGRQLPHPVNYVLVRIIPPAGVEIDQRKRPFVTVDPRAHEWSKAHHRRNALYRWRLSHHRLSLDR